MNYPVFQMPMENELAPGTGIFLDYPYVSSGMPSAPQFSMGDYVSQVGDYVWDGVKGTWVSLKEEIKDVGGMALEGVDSIMATGIKYFLLVVAGIALLFFIVGKSGFKASGYGFSLG